MLGQELLPRFLAITGVGLKMVTWDAQTGRPLNELETDGQMGFSRDGERLVTLHNNTAQVFETRTGKPVGPGIKSDEFGVAAVALSPDGRNLYVASRRSQAVAVFRRNQSTGKLTQAPGPAGCVAARGAEGCGFAVGLGGPNSVAVSPDGKNVYATSAQGNSIAIFRRDPTTGALAQSVSGTAVTSYGSSMMDKSSGAP